MTTVVWRETELSVNPPSEEISVDTVKDFVFISTDPATGASCVLIDLSTGLEFSNQPDAPSFANDEAIVRINSPSLGLVRDGVYELRVLFTDGDEAWAGTLVIPVVS